RTQCTVDARGLVVVTARKSSLHGIHVPTSAWRRLLIGDHRVDAATGKLCPSTKEAELDEERKSDDLTAEPLGQPCRRSRSAAGRDDVVDDQDALTGCDRVAVDL